MIGCCGDRPLLTVVSLHPAQCCTGVKQEQEVSLQAGGAGGEGACEGAPAWQELGQEVGVRRQESGEV